MFIWSTLLLTVHWLLLLLLTDELNTHARSIHSTILLTLVLYLLDLS